MSYYADNPAPRKKKARKKPLPLESQQVREWMAQAALSAHRDSLRILLEDKFGSLPAELIQQIEFNNDPDRLLAAMLQVSRIQNLADLRM
jgi:hypothetical protein